jgi:ribosomal protein S21
MAISVKKKEGETTGSFLRRFSRKIQQSGVLVRARKARFYEEKPNKRATRMKALRKETKRKEIETLKKLGKFEEIYGKRGKGRRR